MEYFIFKSLENLVNKYCTVQKIYSYEDTLTCEYFSNDFRLNWIMISLYLSNQPIQKL